MREPPPLRPLRLQRPPPRWCGRGGPRSPRPPPRRRAQPRSPRPPPRPPLPRSLSLFGSLAASQQPPRRDSVRPLAPGTRLRHAERWGGRRRQVGGISSGREGEGRRQKADERMCVRSQPTLVPPQPPARPSP
ncbi:pre-mRNA-splicing factor CWC22 [Rhinolophus ferrumequinum]|uniref:pre-mRNA-splicing factor CWC22 n=1 Tax=Rhinolophus ferrumequinum TaxID=59479 RepID=UPI00140FA8E0|nr:pre-mRNA-splicing factor CWC22 [Rhinolophus ferrumequinum]